MSEESRHKSHVYIIVGMGALVAFAVMVQLHIPGSHVTHDASLKLLPPPIGAENYPNVDSSLLCADSISPVADESSKIKYMIMTPKVLPEQYSLQAVEAISGNGIEMITLYYWDKPLCDLTKSLIGGPVLNGAVVVRVADSLKVPNAYAEMVETVNRAVPKSNFQTLQLNGVFAIGHQPSNGLPLSQDGFPYPARIFLVSNNILYNLEANMALEDLVDIAESMS